MSMELSIRVPASMNPIHNGHLRFLKIIEEKTWKPIHIDIQTELDKEDALDVDFRVNLVLNATRWLFSVLTVWKWTLSSINVNDYSWTAIWTDQFNAFINFLGKSDIVSSRLLKFLSFEKIYIVQRPEFPIVENWMEILKNKWYDLDKFVILPSSELTCSATGIRELLKGEWVKWIKGLVPDSVYKLLKENYR